VVKPGLVEVGLIFRKEGFNSS